MCVCSMAVHSEMTDYHLGAIKMLPIVVEEEGRKRGAKGVVMATASPI